MDRPVTLLRSQALFQICQAFKIPAVCVCVRCGPVSGSERRNLTVASSARGPVLGRPRRQWRHSLLVATLSKLQVACCMYVDLGHCVWLRLWVRPQLGQLGSHSCVSVEPSMGTGGEVTGQPLLGERRKKESRLNCGSRATPQRQLNRERGGLTFPLVPPSSRL